MISGLSDYWEAIVMDALVKGSAITPPASVWLGLFTTTILKSYDIGTPTEVTGGSYARVQLTFASWSAGFSLTSAAATFPAPTAAWGTVVAWAICDASSSGHIVFFENICGLVIANGDPALSFKAKQIKAALNITRD